MTSHDCQIAMAVDLAETQQTVLHVDLCVVEKVSALMVSRLQIITSLFTAMMDD